MKRVNLLNYLATTNNYESYLEIGCEANSTFKSVGIAHKVGIDPQTGGTLRLTSDEYFRINCEKFDLIFVDGLHHCEQVLKDVENSLLCLKTGGCIVLHDCLPERESHQCRQQDRRGATWTGDVWKAAVQLRTRLDLDMAVLNRDWGLGVLFPRTNSDPILLPETIDWEFYRTKRKEMLRIMGVTEMKQFISQESVLS